MGRTLAKATFFDSHSADDETGINWAMDLSPLVQNKNLDITEYTLGYVDRLKVDIQLRLKTFQ